MMDHHIVDFEGPVQESESCGCRGRNLDILEEVHRAYEAKMDEIERNGGCRKLELQVEMLRAWVADLVGQNSLLSRAVQELEHEATARVLDRRRFQEMLEEVRVEGGALRRRLARKDSDLRGVLEVLRRLREFDFCTPLNGIHFHEVTESDIFGSSTWRKEKLGQGDSTSFEILQAQTHKSKERLKLKKHNKFGEKSDKSKMRSERLTEMKMLNEKLQTREREIRRLNKDLQKYEQTVNKGGRPCQRALMKDAEVMAGMCCTGTEMALVAASSEMPPQQSPTREPAETDTLQQRINAMEATLKVSTDKVSELRLVNVALHKEVQFVQQLCALLDDNNRRLTTSVTLRDDIIREMRKQLTYHKNKIASMSTQMPRCSREEGTSVCIVESPRQKTILIPDSPVSKLSSSPRSNTVSFTPAETESPHQLRMCPGTDSNTHSPRSRCSKGININASALQVNEGFPRHQCANEEYVGNVEATAHVLQNIVRETETRCGQLQARNAQLMADRARAEKQIQKLRRTLRESNVGVPSVCVSTEPERTKSQMEVVTAVQNKLSIIEDLYRNCFYETVRQDAVIELLRKALLEVRETESTRMKGMARSPWGSKHGSDKGVRQQWDTGTCHHILAEVDNLKTEISDYISNSNNDSGMWGGGGGGSEESSQDGITDELDGILTQLALHRSLLTEDIGSCNCSDNHCLLKKENEDLQSEVTCLKCKINELESSIAEKEQLLLRYEGVIEGQDNELKKVRQELTQAGDKAKQWESNAQKKEAVIENLNAKIQELHELLNAKTGELEDVQEKCKAQEVSLQELKGQLEETAQDRSEVGSAARGVAAAARCGARRARDTTQRYWRLHHAHTTLQDKYRVALHQSRCLGAELAAAQRGGAALCERTRAVLHEQRRHFALAAGHHRMQQEIIREKDLEIQRLRDQLRSESGSSSERTSVNEMPCCSKSLFEGERKCASARETTTVQTDPAPCGDDRCPYWRCSERNTPVLSLTHRRAASLCRRPRPDTCCLSASLEAQFASTTAPLMEGISQLQEALATGQRRWQRRDPHSRHHR